MWKKGMASAVLLVLIGLLAWNLFGPKEPAIGLEKGDQAPDFELKTLDGKTASLSDYRGKRCSSISGRHGVSLAGRKCRI